MQQTIEPRKDIPERVRPDEMGGMPKENKGMPGGLKSVIIMLLVAAVVSYGVVSFYAMPKMITQAKFSTEINSLSNNVSSDITELEGTIATLKSQMTELQGSLVKQINAQNTAVDQKIAGINLDGYAKVTELNAAITDLQTKLDAYHARLTSNESTTNSQKTEIAALKSEIATLKSDLATLKTDVAKLKTDVTALQTTTTTTPPPTTTTTTPSPTGVSITVVNPTVTLTPTLFTNTFNVTITNNSTKGIYGGQVAFTVQLIGLPAGEGIDIALSGTPLASSLITWSQAPSITPPTTAYFVGEFSGFIDAGSSKIVTITVDLVSGSASNLIMKVTSPTISGYITY